MRPEPRVGDNDQKLESIAVVGPRLAEEVCEVPFAARFGSATAPGDGARTAIRAPAETAEEIEIDTTGAGSDAELGAAALAAIKRNALIPPGKVRPTVRNGWLILEGEVEGAVQKRAAEAAVRGLNGIRGMSNNILIESEVMADLVTHKISELFVRSARLSASRISVTARDHRIILSGFARSGEERAEAETAAWGVPGVAEVVNRIRAIA